MQTKSGQKILLDAAPAIQAAVTAVTNNNGFVYIPANNAAGENFLINSYLPISVANGVRIFQVGNLNVGETIDLTGTVMWDGWTTGNTPQFGVNGGAVINGSVANPVLHATGAAINLNHLVINGNGNASTDIVTDDAVLMLDHVNLDTYYSANDLLGMALVYRATGQTIEEESVSNTLLTGGPSQTNNLSWTPLMWIAPAQNGSGSFAANNGMDVELSYVMWNVRGIEMDGAGGNMNIKWSYRQGGITPMVTLVGQGSNATYHWDHVYQDTEGQPLVANFANSPRTAVGSFIIDTVSGSTGTTLITGNRPISTSLMNYGGDSLGVYALQNRAIQQQEQYANMLTYPIDSADLYIRTQPVVKTAMPEMIVGGPSKYWAMAPPTSITSSVSVASTIAAGTYVWSVSATGPDGGETVPQQVPSAPLALNGSQGALIRWTPTLGAVSYNIYRCKTSFICTYGGVIGQSVYGVSQWYRIATHVAGTSYTDTTAAPSYNLAPAITGTGISGMNDSMAWAPKFLCPEMAAPPGIAGFDTLYCDSTTHQPMFMTGIGTPIRLAGDLVATSAAFATATTAGTCVQNTTAVTGAATTMVVHVSPVRTPGTGAVWSALVSSAGNVTITECAIARSAGGSIAFNIRVIR